MITTLLYSSLDLCCFYVLTVTHNCCELHKYGAQTFYTVHAVHIRNVLRELEFDSNYIVKVTHSQYTKFIYTFPTDCML